MQREVFQRRIYFQAILTRRSREQLTVCYQYFYFIMIQISVQILLSLLTRQPRSSQSDITNTLAFISQFINRGFRRKLKVFFRLYVVCFG